MERVGHRDPHPVVESAAVDVGVEVLAVVAERLVVGPHGVHLEPLAVRHGIGGEQQVEAVVHPAARETRQAAGVARALGHVERETRVAVPDARHEQRVLAAPVVVGLGFGEADVAALGRAVEVGVTADQEVRARRRGVEAVTQVGALDAARQGIGLARLEVEGVEAERRRRRVVAHRRGESEHHGAGPAGRDRPEAAERDLCGLPEERHALARAHREPGPRPLAGLHHVEHVVEERVPPSSGIDLLRDQHVGVDGRHHGAEVGLSGRQRAARVLEQVPGHDPQRVRGRRRGGGEQQRGQYHEPRGTDSRERAHG